MTETLWPGGPPVHPAAAVFPLMEGDEFEQLAASIKQNGLREPIWLMPDGSVLDGRNRWLACRKVGVEPSFRTYEGGDGDPAVDFVLDMNLERRHLSPGQKAMVGAAAANVRADQFRGNQHVDSADLHCPDDRVTLQEAADRVGVSRRSVAEAQYLRRNASPNIVKAVQRDEIGVTTAATAVKAINDEAGSVEAGKQRQETLTIEEIKRREKEERRKRMVAAAREQEARGGGNKYNAFVIAHGRDPGPEEARRIAMETGQGVPDCNGTIQPPATKAEIKEQETLDLQWGRLNDAFKLVETVSPTSLVRCVPEYQKDMLRNRLPAVIDRLDELLSCLESGGPESRNSGVDPARPATFN